MKTLFVDKEIDEKVEKQKFYDGNFDNKIPKPIRTEVKLVTPQMAKNWLSVNTINRNLNKRLVNHYARQMKEGLWELTGEPLIFSSGKLLDGQHRLSALIQANVEIYFLCVFNINEDTFKVMNTGKSRSASEIFDISGIKNYVNVSSGIRKYFALKLKLTPSRGISNNPVSLVENNLTAKELLDFYYEHELFISELGTRTIPMYHNSRILKISEILGYILYLYFEKKYDIKRIYNFFEPLTTGRDINNNAIYLLRKKLIEEKTNMKKLPGVIKNALIIKAWNAFITGRELRILKYDQEREQKPEFI